jgi:hypothetical protein
LNEVIPPGKSFYNFELLTTNPSNQRRYKPVYKAQKNLGERGKRIAPRSSSHPNPSNQRRYKPFYKAKTLQKGGRRIAPISFSHPNASKKVQAFTKA